MRFEWLGIAEASAVDARGAVALIGLNQNIEIASVVPAMVRRTVMVYAVDDPDEDRPPGSTIHVTIGIASPSGETARQEFELVTQPKNFPELPGAIQVATEFVFRAPEHGTYRVSAVIEPSAEERLEREIEFHVVQPVGDGRPQENNESLQRS
jgi:hypothetical protein